MPNGKFERPPATPQVKEKLPKDVSGEEKLAYEAWRKENPRASFEDWKKRWERIQTLKRYAREEAGIEKEA